MSKENVEIARAATDAFNRRDLEASLKDLAPDFEYDLSRAVGPWHGVYALDEMPGLFKDLSETWESNRYEVDEFIEAGELVVGPFTNYLRGRDGIEVEARAAFVWTIRNGMIARLTFYQEPHDALEAAGLSE